MAHQQEPVISLHAAIQSGAWSTAQELLAAFRLEVEASWRAAANEQERRAISEQRDRLPAMGARDDPDLPRARAAPV